MMARDCLDQKQTILTSLQNYIYNKINKSFGMILCIKTGLEKYADISIA